MEINPILIIGTGPEGRIALDIFNDNGVVAYAFLDYKKDFVGELVNEIPVFNTVDHPDSKKVLSESAVDYIVAVGEPDKRMELHKTLNELTGKPGVNALHKLSFISPFATLGFGNILNAGTVINANSSIGDYNIFHSYVSLEPDAHIGSFNTINSGVRIGSNTEIGDEVFIGTGAVIHPGVKIGNKAVIGAGSVVLKSVKEGKTVFGNPAKEV